MNILYIGQYTSGTTSKMRADQLKSILQTDTFHVIDTNIPFLKTNRLWRSFGFRFKRGPLIQKMNQYVLKELESLIKIEITESQRRLKERGEIMHRNDLLTIFSDLFSLIWVDKGIFLTSKTTIYIKTLTKKLVHFTPDMAFYGNQSMLFEKSIHFYDYLITTKTAEIKEYTKHITQNRLIVCTQGFDKNLHKPVIPFNQKDDTVAFIGLCEPSREQLVQKLIDNKIKVKLAGKGWKAFMEKNKHNIFLQFKGEGLFSEQYTQFIASARFSIGMLSKNFPELHTTRTFEIPACGTALITERNIETSTFFNDNEAIFYDSMDEIMEKIKHYQSHLNELEQLTEKGIEKVYREGRDYESILRGVIEKIKNKTTNI